MLKPTPVRRVGRPVTGRVAIVASRYNARYVDAMIRFARAGLGGLEVEVVRVPGAFEIPLAARWLLQRPEGHRPDALICLGLIWQGETTHADHVAISVTNALMGLQVETGVPCVHEVLQVRTAEQARARCLDSLTNRGGEAASTVLELLRLRRALARPGSVQV